MDKEMSDRIQAMAARTWGHIGGDVLTALEEAGESPVMLRGDVVEVVMDAGYMKMYGDDEEAYEFYHALPYDEKTKVITEAFPFVSYGW